MKNIENWIYEHQEIEKVYLVYTIKDIAIKWGIPVANDPNVMMFNAQIFGIDRDVRFYTHIREGNQIVFVHSSLDDTGVTELSSNKRDFEIIKIQSGTNYEPQPGGELIPVHKEMGGIVWYHSVRQEDVEFVISEADKLGKERGLVDEYGVRLPIAEPPLLMPQKYKVEEVFRDKLTVFPIGDEDDLEKRMAEFDHPEDITYYRDLFSGLGGLVKKDTIPLRKKRGVIMNEILSELKLSKEDLLNGFQSNPQVFGPLISEIRAEMERRLEINQAEEPEKRKRHKSYKK